MKKKLVSILLCGAMVATMFGCGKSSDVVEENNDVAEEVEVVKPESIKVMVDGTVPTQENYGADFWAKYTELTGIKVDLVQPDHDAYYDVLGQTIAGGDWPDVVILSSTYYAGYAGQGVLWDMTDAYAASDLKARHDAKGGSSVVVDSLRIDGQLYGMPATRGNGCVTYVKQSWMDEAGITAAPTTYAEYIDMLRAFKQLHPDKYPVTAAGFIGSEAPFTNYLPEFYQDAYPSFMQDASGAWVDGFESQAMKDAMQRLADAYAEGLIDPTTLTNGTGDCRNKFYADDCSVFTYWAGTWANNLKTNLEANELDGNLVALAPIAEVGAYVDRITPAWCITSTCANPEGVFKYFIEAMQDGGDVQFLFTYGVEGKHWSTAADTLFAGTEKEKTFEAGTFHFLENAEKEGTQYTKAHIDPMLALVELQAPENSVTDVAMAAQELFNTHSKAAWITPSTDEMAELNGDLTTLKNELIAKVAMGEMTVDEAYAKYESEKTGKEASDKIVESLNK